MCVFIIALVAEKYIIFLTPNYDWRIVFDQAIMGRQFVSLKNLSDLKRRSRHLQLILSLKTYHLWYVTIL